MKQLTFKLKKLDNMYIIYDLYLLKTSNSSEKLAIKFQHVAR